MSDVGDVNRAHLPKPEESIVDAYMRAARAVQGGTTSPTVRLGWIALHNAKNVVLLADLVDALRAENTNLMEMLYGGVDSSDEG